MAIAWRLARSARRDGPVPYGAASTAVDIISAARAASVHNGPR